MEKCYPYQRISAIRKGSSQSILFLFLITLWFPAFSQRHLVTGIVQNEEKTGLPGAIVLVQGTTQGVIADEKGRYKIEVAKGTILEYSMLNHQKEIRKIKDHIKLDVALASVAEKGEIITGYTSQKRKHLTSAISILDGGKVNNYPSSSFNSKLNQRISGMTVSTSGKPGAETQVRIRGLSSFQNNDPLYIVDGVPTNDPFQNGLNSYDIESIQVLKDASATAIYGMRGNNGVIIVTTKKGIPGKARVTYNGSFGIQESVGKYNLITNSEDYSEAIWQAYDNAGLSIPSVVPYSAGSGEISEYLYAESSQGYPGNASVDESQYEYPNSLIMKSNSKGTDWWEEVFSPAFVNEHSVGISGGNNSSRYYVSTGYLDQKGTMKNTYFKRATIRVNSSHKAGKFLFGENFALSRSQSIGQPYNNLNESSVLTEIVKMHPIVPVYDISGENFAGNKAKGLGKGQNPVAILDRNKDNQAIDYQVIGNAYGIWNIRENLTFQTELGINYQDRFIQTFSYPNWETIEPSTLNGFHETWSKQLGWNWTNSLKYDRRINKNQKIEAYLGYESLKQTTRRIDGSQENYFLTNQNLWYLNPALADPTTAQVFSQGNVYSMISTFGKVNYNYKEKILIQASFRRDGSSLLGVEKYGIFPAVSAGWWMSKEGFMKKAKWIKELQLRAGWGKTGNHLLRANNTFNQFNGTPESTYYDINGINNGLVPGLAISNQGNPSTKWEENTSINLGLDASLFKGKWYVKFDAYKRTTEGILFNPELPTSLGTADAPYVNIASMENKGLDINVDYQDDLVGGMKLSIGAIFSAYRNKILQLDGKSTSFFTASPHGSTGQTTIHAVDHPMGSFYGYLQEGLFMDEGDISGHAQQEGASVGRIKFADLNADDVIDEKDKGIIGNPHPDFTGGVTVGLDFGNLSISGFLYGSYGNDIYNFQKQFTHFASNETNLSPEVLTSTYHPSDNPSGSLPMLDVSDVYSSQSSSFYIEDGSFLRVRTVQITYDFPKWILGSHLEHAQIYIQGNNLFTFTKYRGSDPELSNINSTGNGDYWMGHDFGHYPISTSAVLGINLGF